jgi:hypothetical protein
MKVGEIDVPEPDDDPAVLAAMFEGYAANEQWRKVVLATCRELVRSSAALSGRRISEARTDDMARQHPSYLQFLEMSLVGRVKWEREVQKGGIGR